MSFSGNLYVPSPTGGTGTFTNPPPGTFDFAGRLANTLFCFDNPLAPEAFPVQGWQSLVETFARAMSSQASQPGDWEDFGYASNFLTSVAYYSWTWSQTASPYPRSIAIPFAGSAPIDLPTPFATGAILRITSIGPVPPPLE